MTVQRQDGFSVNWNYVATLPKTTDVSTVGGDKKLSQQEAFDQFKDYLTMKGGSALAKKALDSAGVTNSAPLTVTQVNHALKTLKDSYVSFEKMMLDPEALVYATKARDLKLQLSHTAPGTQNETYLNEKLTQLKEFTVAMHSARVCGKYINANVAKPDAPNTQEKAMLLAIQVRVLSRQIATEKINNPRAQPAIAKELFTAHEENLLEKGHTPDELRLAKVLAGDDPIMLFLKDKITLEDACLRLQEMSQQAGTVDGEKITPGKMWNLMLQQLESELACYTMDELKKGTIKHDIVGVDGKAPNGSFSLYELNVVGEMNPEFFEKLFGDHKQATVQNGMMVFTQTTTERLTALAKQVGAWDTGSGLSDVTVKDPVKTEITELPEKQTSEISLKKELPKDLLKQITEFDAKTLNSVKQMTDVIALPGVDGVTKNQYALMREIVMSENGNSLDPYTRLENQVDPTDTQEPKRTYRQQVVDHICDAYGIDKTQAGDLLEKSREWFKTAPLTIAFKGQDYFSESATPKYGTANSTAQVIAKKPISSEQMSEMLGGKGTESSYALPSNTGETARGANYLRWRMEKDDAETRHKGLSPQEQAKFGSVNLNFAKTGGFEGNDYYGNCFFELKPEVRNRCLFNFNKSRELRSDVVMLMYDMIKDKNSSNTPAIPFIDAIAHNALGLSVGDKGMVPIPNAQLEVEVFGDLDMVNDVASVHIPNKDAPDDAPKDAPNPTKAVRENLEKFFSTSSVPVKKWDPDTVSVGNTNTVARKMRPDVAKAIREEYVKLGIKDK